MPLGASLAAHMAGVYRYGGSYRVFPRPGLPHWEVVLNHEFTHAVLGIATTAGLLHQVLAYLGHGSSSPNRSHWRELYDRAVALSQTAHESTATFVSLCESSQGLSLGATFSAYGVPARYREWYALLDRVVPADLPPDLRAALARSIGTYAFDDPLQAMRSATWESLCQLDCGMDLLPRVDERFYALVRFLLRDGVVPLVDALTQPAPATWNAWKGMPAREFLAHRRKVAYETDRILRTLLLRAYGEDIEARPYETASLCATATAVIGHLKTVLAANKDAGLLPFERDFSDTDGEDPLLYDCEVLMPNAPLSGLLRVSGPQSLPESPALVHVAEAAVDCVLSASLILRQGQHYSRCFVFDEHGTRKPEVFYFISEEFPVDIWELSGPPLVVLNGGREIDPGMVAAYNRPLSTPVLLWLPRLSRDSFDFVLATAGEWQYEFISWLDCSGVATLLLFHARYNAAWAVNLIGAPLEIFAEEAQKQLRGLTHGSEISRGLIWTIVQCLPWVAPSEGVPVKPS